jgi:hypothetical protein
VAIKLPALSPGSTARSEPGFPCCPPSDAPDAAASTEAAVVVDCEEDAPATAAAAPAAAVTVGAWAVTGDTATEAVFPLEDSALTEHAFPPWEAAHVVVVVSAVEVLEALAVARAP